ncbi:ThiF family adenylyltransferase [Fulvivirgaceae bacterium LMO-SS25]
MTSHRGKIHWFKRHPEFLKLVSISLSNDSNYKEIHQSRNNLFISHGRIIVRLNKVYSHSILIVYTDATPYQLPFIFPLKEDLSDEYVTELSKLSLVELVSKIRPFIEFHYHLRHQNGSGALCFLERADLDDGSKFYGIKSILKRVRDWFAGHVTGNFPPDNEAVEFCSHFNKINQLYEFIYSEPFINEDLVYGQFYGTIVRNFGDFRYIFVGSLIDGQSKTGLVLNNKYLLKEPLHPNLKTSEDFVINNSLVNEYIKKGQLLTGLWFHIESILSPFENFEELLKIIGRGDLKNGIERVNNASPHFFSLLENQIFIGIRYPDKKGALQFQLFLIKQKDEALPIELIGDPITRMTSILKRYEEVEAVWSEKLTEEEFHLRNGKRANHKILKNKTINLFGVGSLGSEVGDSLAKAGIGTLYLVDNQKLRAHNSVRHIAGINYTGIPKVIASSQIYMDHNLYINIKVDTYDIYSQPEMMLLLQEDSISISSVADDNVEGYINEQAVSAGKTVFYVRSLRGGKVGRIFRVIPGKDACFQCLSLYLSEKGSILKIEEDPDYPVLMNECNNPIRPASAADLKMLSSIVSRLLIEHVQDGEAAHNHWIWSTEVLTKNNINSPYTLQSQFINPHPNCYYCTTNRELTISIKADVLEFMKRLVKEKQGVETGGVLVGKVDKEGNIKIMEASDSGPKAIHKVNEFHKDVEFCQTFLDDHYLKSEKEMVYVGEWHSHPCLNNKPSGLDIKSLSEISEQSEYLTMNPIMIIFSSEGDPSCTVHPTGKSYYSTEIHIV